CGLGMERLLSKAREKGIVLFDLHRLSYTRLRCRVNLIMYFRLRRLRGGRKITICRAKGLAWLLFFAKRRWWVPVSVCISLLLLTIFSSLCLSVRIEGLDKVSEYDVRATLKEEGAAPWVWKDSINVERLEYRLLTAYPALTYAYADFDGVELVVRVAEGIEPPNVQQRKSVSLYAAKDATITRMTVRAGHGAAKEGQRVKAGDLLIAGRYSKGELEFDLAAQGNVMALVDYKAECTAGYAAQQLTPTGRTAVLRYLQFGHKTVLIEGENPFDEVIIRRREAAVIGENMPISIRVIEEVCHEAKRTFAKENKEAAILQAKEQAYYKALENVSEDGQIKAFKIHVIEEEGSVRVVAVLTVLEDIAREGPSGDAFAVESEVVQ
ncbi:MAG: sporulation protein YqfD, partial [Christensenellaceae bacterium]|nr:sporulation protein YqfD [Christensenellaceae bacterium]